MTYTVLVRRKIQPKLFSFHVCVDTIPLNNYIHFYMFFKSSDASQLLVIWSL
jgi:hypothetical protein